MRLPIRVRLTAGYALFLAAILVALGAFIVIKLRADLRSTIDREVRSSSGAIAQSYATEGAPGFVETSAAALRRNGSAAQVLDQQGHVLLSYGGDIAQDPMLRGAVRARAMAGSGGPFDLTLGDSQQPFHVIAMPVRFKASKGNALFRIGVG